MPEDLTVYLHFPCFDGVISAVLACEYLERKHGWKTEQIVPVNYSGREKWASQPLAKPAAVVDFLSSGRGFLGRSSSNDFFDAGVRGARQAKRF